MSNSGTHLLVGGASGLAGMICLKWLRNERLTFWEGVAGVLIGCSGAFLPDFFEPPISPSHRKILHSVGMGAAGIPFTISKIYRGAWTLTPGDRDFLIILSLGYLSHLILDARTPKGLPIF